MSVIKPFRALRPQADEAQRVSCVPYDVISHAELQDLVSENPRSFLRVTRPECDLSENAGADAALARARANLQNLLDENLLAQDAEPALYVYRLASPTHTQTGVVAACSLDEYDAGLIKKHEKTRPDKVEDRTNHILKLRAQTGLIFFAFRGTAEIENLLAAAVEQEPLYNFTCAGDVRHTIWKTAQSEPLVDAFERVPALYIADGHHRAESASLARRILREQNPQHTGEESYNTVVAGIFPAEELTILPYNRVVRDLNDLGTEEFFARAAEHFAVTETENPEPEKRGEFCVYAGDGWRKLVFKGESENLNPVERLDVSLLHRFLLAPVLGIGDERTDERIEFVGGAHGAAELRRRVDAGEARVAFSLFPTTVEDLFTVSDMNEIMPPKSTWFEPKLRDGLLIHLI